MPTWSPTFNRLALVSDTGTRSSVWVLDGLQSYLDRLLNPVRVHTFEPVDKN